MGRNFFYVCHKCRVSMMLYRRQENLYMQDFANEHHAHESATEIYNDYVEEPPEDYENVTPEPEELRKKENG